MEYKFAEVPEDLWSRLAPLLPRKRPNRKGGRPRVLDRVILAGILYRLRTGCQWKALPDRFGSGSTCHRRMQQWVRAGVFKRAFQELLREYDRKRGVQWKWASLDAAIVKAPKGGAARGRTRRTGRNSE